MAVYRMQRFGDFLHCLEHGGIKLHRNLDNHIHTYNGLISQKTVIRGFRYQVQFSTHVLVGYSACTRAKKWREKM